MKRLITLVFIICMSALTVSAQKTTIDGVIYKGHKDGNATVTGAEKGVTDIVIKPQVTIEGKEYTVNAIGGAAFWRSKQIRSVIIPNTVTVIQTQAFLGCKGLKSVEIPESVITIESGAFDGSGLESVVLPKNLEQISYQAFNNTNLRELVIPQSVTVIKELAFNNCKYLQTIVFPDNYCKMPSTYSPFMGCSSITTIRGHNESMPTYLFAAMQKDKNLRLVYDRMVAQQQMNSIIAGNTAPVAAAQPQPTVTEEKTEVKSDVDVKIPNGLSGNNKTFAVIIGNENYESVPAVEFARKDASIFAEYCQKTLGLPENNIRKYEDATYGKTLAALKDLGAIAGAFNGDISIIVYYAGHGIPDGKGNAYLLPIDADGSQMDICLSTSKLYEELNKMNARSTVVFMDACFSGAQRGSGMLMAARGVAIKAKAETPNGNCVVFTAANDEETAYPYKEKGHGLFTYFLLKKLQETNGNVTLGELADYITNNVKQQSVIVNRRGQTPVILCSPSLNNWQSIRLAQ